MYIFLLTTDYVIASNRADLTKFFRPDRNAQISSTHQVNASVLQIFQRIAQGLMKKNHETFMYSPLSAIANKTVAPANWTGDVVVLRLPNRLVVARCNTKHLAPEYHFA
jgi:hypothetical protein